MILTLRQVKLLRPLLRKVFFPFFPLLFTHGCGMQMKCFSTFPRCPRCQVRAASAHGLTLGGDLQMHIYPFLSRIRIKWTRPPRGRWGGPRGAAEFPSRDRGVPSPQGRGSRAIPSIVLSRTEFVTSTQACQPCQGCRRESTGKHPLIFPGVTLSGYKSHPKICLKKLKGRRAPPGTEGLRAAPVQWNLCGKFTVWGLFSIFDLIYSAVLSLTPQGQPM